MVFKVIKLLLIKVLKLVYFLYKSVWEIINCFIKDNRFVYLKEIVNHPPGWLTLF